MQARIVAHLYNRAQGMLQGRWEDYGTAAAQLEAIGQALSAKEAILLDTDNRGAVLIPPEEARHALFFLEPNRPTDEP